jgi:hypothetical protein|tara:strand:+ start:157 stop:729 length:573 start_codon:yes stop_codon:yes gene_type:complete
MDKLLDNINLVRIREFLHAYHIPGLHDILLEHKDLMDKIFENGDKERNEQNQNNVMLSDNDLTKIVAKVNLNIVKKYYDAGENYGNPEEVGIYRQTNEEYASNFHVHHKSTMISTMYINPPAKGEGGEFMIQIPPHQAQSFQVKKDWVYFIPGWLPHTPSPQISSTPRYCINWAYDSNIRAFNKLTGDIW